MSNFFTGIEALSNTFCTYREPIVPIDTSGAASPNDQANNPSQTDANLVDKPARRGNSGHADSEEKSGKWNDENESDPNGNPECADKSGLADSLYNADKSSSSDESSNTDESKENADLTDDDFDPLYNWSIFFRGWWIIKNSNWY